VFKGTRQDKKNVGTATLDDDYCEACAAETLAAIRADRDRTLQNIGKGIGIRNRK